MPVRSCGADWSSGTSVPAKLAQTKAQDPQSHEADREKHDQLNDTRKQAPAKSTRFGLRGATVERSDGLELSRIVVAAKESVTLQRLSAWAAALYALQSSDTCHSSDQKRFRRPPFAAQPSLESFDA